MTCNCAKIIFSFIMLSIIGGLIYGSIHFANTKVITGQECFNKTQSYIANITVYLGEQFNHVNSDGSLSYVFVYQTNKNCVIYSVDLPNIGDRFVMYRYNDNWCYLSIDAVKQDCEKDYETKFALCITVSIIFSVILIFFIIYNCLHKSDGIKDSDIYSRI